MEQIKEITVTLSDVQIASLSRGEAIAIKIEPTAKTSQHIGNMWMPKGGEYIINLLDVNNIEDSARQYGLSYDSISEKDEVKKYLIERARQMAFVLEDDAEYSPYWDGVKENYYVVYDPLDFLGNSNYYKVASTTTEIHGVVFMSKETCTKYVQYLNEGRIIL